MEALGKALGDLSGVTGSVLDIFRAYMDAVKDKVDYNSAEVQTRVKTMTGVLVTFGLALRDAAKAALDAQQIADLEAMPALEKLASALGNIASILKDALDISKLSKDMAAYKPQSVGSVINTKLQIILDDVIAMAKAFAAKAQGAGLSEELQKAADALAPKLE
jgi:hypothetical protein